MQTVSKELLDVAKTHDKNYLHFMDAVKIILFLKYLEGIPAWFLRWLLLNKVYKMR